MAVRKISWTENDFKRFCRFIQFTSDCWLYSGTKTSYGYGSFSLNGVKIHAHQFSYALTHQGSLPKVVRHRCHNPACMRYDHLLGGTQVENAADAIARGTIGRTVFEDTGKSSKSDHGEHNPQARFTQAQVYLLRERYAAENISVRSLAREHGVSHTTMRKVLSGQRYREA